jgi:hypothetical protein
MNYHEILIIHLFELVIAGEGVENITYKERKKGA